MHSITQTSRPSTRLSMTPDSRTKVPDSRTRHSPAAVSRLPWEYRDAVSASASSCSGRQLEQLHFFARGDGRCPSPLAFCSAQYDGGQRSYALNSRATLVVALWNFSEGGRGDRRGWAWGRTYQRMGDWRRRVRGRGGGRRGRHIDRRGHWR